MAPRKNAFWKQVGFLSTKDLTILVSRHPVSTLYAALMLPVLMSIYLGIGQNLQGSGNKYGVSDARPARSLADGLAAADGSRSKVVFVDNGFTSGDIDTVIGSLTQQVTKAGKTAVRVRDAVEMGTVCTVSFQGSTPCYGGVVFNGSPSQGMGGMWNYTLRGDAVLGQKFDVRDDRNDPQVYVLPLQRAVDVEIARVSNSTVDTSGISGNLQERAFTDLSEDERAAEANRRYQDTFVNFMGVAVLLAFFGIAYHLPGYIATERERGLSQLVDAMMATRARWEAQAIRMVAYFASFSAVYLTGWIVGGVILKVMVWKKTSGGIVVPYFVVAGVASTAQALVGGTLFKRAQLSGMANGLAFLLLGVLAQAVPNLGTGGAVVLGLLFTPCNMILMIKYMSRAEAAGFPADMLRAPPGSDHQLPAIALWMFLLVQIVVFPLLAAGLERWIHGAAADTRTIWTGTNGGGNGARPEHAVVVEGLTKTFAPSLVRRLFSFISRPRPATVAVKNLSLAVPHGQIVALLGANGCGKSTTLDSIAGLQGFKTGRVTVDASGGVGVAPQKNVLWDELTVWEHVQLFNRLKAPFAQASEGELRELLRQVGLRTKMYSRSDTLSGGQKRKLQLALMLTGGSSVCCIDEVSSGIDPLSRRKIWDILLAERGRRTIILTTHFLDEADLLSDKIAIMSKGRLRAEGSAVELKASLGSGFRVRLSKPRDHQQPPNVAGVQVRIRPDSVVYLAPSSAVAAEVIRVLERHGIAYSLSSPTIEDVFLHTAEEYAAEAGPAGITRQDSDPLLLDRGDADEHDDNDEHRKPLDLLSGKKVGMAAQTLVLLRKRAVLLRNNWLPYLIAVLIPVVAAAVMQVLVRNEQPATCVPERQDQLASLQRFDELLTNTSVVAGPASAVSNVTAYSASGASLRVQPSPIDAFGAIQSVLDSQRRTIFPGGFFAGSAADRQVEVMYRANGRDGGNPMSAAVVAQNLLDTTVLAVRIAVGYAAFDASFGAVDKTLQLAIFFSVVLAIAPAFLALYVNLERRSNVRSLQYSSGVRAVPQWLSHVLFDFGIMVLPVVAAALIFNFTSDVFWNGAYLVPVFLLYVLASILVGYIISLFTQSQLSTWASVAAYNGIGLAIYFIAFLFIISLSAAPQAQNNIFIAHYVIAIVFPLGSMMRAMLVSLNVFAQACSGPQFIANPGSLPAFGGPILYLVIQSVVFFLFLLLNDSKVQFMAMFTRQSKVKRVPVRNGPNAQRDVEKGVVTFPGLKVKRITKQFGDFRAVNDVSFEVNRGEVYALLGPNGAGKSTTIGIIRGDLRPSDGDVLVERHSVTRERAAARSSLGVCPQFDAIDEMTTEQHLRHYARLRGIAAIDKQVDAVVRAVGLGDFRHTMAGHLSGGNKRKLSLGMALTGNPSVILLDEPSSGLDAAAKRIMWATLKTVVPGRSILLTTHSMEEADTLASRAGILAKNMLASGSVAELQHQFGDSLYVHLVSRTAPHSTAEEMEHMRAGVMELFPEASTEEKTYHGQMRFSVPASSIRAAMQHKAASMAVSPVSQQTATSPRQVSPFQGRAYGGEDNDDEITRFGSGSTQYGSGEVEGQQQQQQMEQEEDAGTTSAIGHVLLMLEENKDRLGIQQHSVAPTTLNDVFLAIVGQHQVKEEGYEKEDVKPKFAWRKVLLGF